MWNTAKKRLKKVEEAYGVWASERGIAMVRVALGVVFVWFGVLKFCPGLCDMEILAARTMQLLTLGLMPAKLCLGLLAVAESGLGIVLIAGRWMRAVTLCLMPYLFGTFLPMVLFPGETWKHFPYAPTLAGQYILKNIVLIAAALLVGANAFTKDRVPMIVPMRRREAKRANLFIELNGAGTQVVEMRGREGRRF